MFPSLHSRRDRPGFSPRAFTIVEVMIAAIVLALGITTSITTLQGGFQAVDVARNYTYASQVMQSEVERLRLKNWTQMQALQLTFFFFLPSILLSGFMFPYRGMPGWAQTFGEIFPLTHFLRITRAVMLKGAELPAVATEIGWLVGFVALFAGVALVRFRRTLD